VLVLTSRLLPVERSPKRLLMACNRIVFGPTAKKGELQWYEDCGRLLLLPDTKRRYLNE